MGVTRFSSQLKTTDSTAKYTEIVIPWQTIIQAFVTNGASTGAKLLGTGGADALAAELASSGLAGIDFASTDEIDFLLKLPNDFDTTGISYLDIYYLAVASATKGDRIGWTVTYNALTPNATADVIGDATTTSGITNPTSRVLATGKCENSLYKDIATVAANTLTEGDYVHGQFTAGTGCAEGELAIQQIVYRYVKKFL